MVAPDFVTFNIDRLPAAAVQRVRRRLPAVAWTVRTAAAYDVARNTADGVIVEGEAVPLAARDIEARHVPLCG